jgi:hypothetical protein
MGIQRFAAVGLLLGVVIGACGGTPDGEPAPEPTKQVEPASTASPGAESPVKDGKITTEGSISNRCIGCPQGCANPPCPTE